MAKTAPGWLRWSIVAAFLLLLFFVARPSHSKPLAPDVRADRVLVEKRAHRLTLFRGSEMLKVYRVALGRGGQGPKQIAGDNRVPEGTYLIGGRNAQSRFYRSLKIGYPTAQQIRAAQQAGVNPGGTS